METTPKRGRQRADVPPTLIEPGTLYTLSEFLKASGLGKTTIRRARERGVELKKIPLGRRKFVRGEDGIAFIEAASLAYEAA